MTNTELEHVASEVRKDILVATHAAKSGHPGGSLSAADILTYLYFEELNRRTFLIVEYGVETCNDDTLRLINR
ncbi:MAG: hypothetical protein ACFNLS_03560, partial [Lancefieldella sp.]